MWVQTQMADSRGTVSHQRTAEVYDQEVGSRLASLQTASTVQLWFYVVEMRMSVRNLQSIALRGSISMQPEHRVTRETITRRVLSARRHSLLYYKIRSVPYYVSQSSYSPVSTLTLLLQVVGNTLSYTDSPTRLATAVENLQPSFCYRIHVTLKRALTTSTQSINPSISSQLFHFFFVCRMNKWFFIYSPSILFTQFSPSKNSLHCTYLINNEMVLYSSGH